MRISDWSSDVCSSDLGNARLTYSAPDPDLKLYDVASVEVLEGPQGKIYGAGSLGGIIRNEPMPPILYAGGGGAWAAGPLTKNGATGVAACTQAGRRWTW